MMKTITKRLTLLLLTVSLVIPGTTYAAFAEERKLTASDGGASDQLGYAISISEDGSRAAIASPSEAAIYVFSRSGTTWTQEQKLTPSGVGDEFGSAEHTVSISGDGTRLIGGGMNGNGHAYIFSRSGTTWTQEQKITASDPEVGSNFGYAVSMTEDGSRVVVGASDKDGVASSTGAAYIFSRSGTTWTQEQKITASDAALNNWLGTSVDISPDGTRLIAGANGVNSQTGAAYIFSRSGTTWTQEQKITASDAAGSDRFGWITAMSEDGSRVVVGAPEHDDGASGQGAAYIFSRSGTTWTEEEEVIGDGAGGDKFGYSVDISNDGSRIAGGGYFDTVTGAFAAGSVTTYTRSGTTWTQEQELTASDREASDLLGWSVALSGDGTRVISGARDEDTGASNAGAAYVFYGPAPVAVTATASGAGSGTVTSNTGGISISYPTTSSSSASIATGSNITITATAGATNQFTNMDADCHATGGTLTKTGTSIAVCTLTNVSADTTISVAFTIPAVLGTGGGIPSSGGGGSPYVPPVVTPTPTPTPPVTTPTPPPVQEVYENPSDFAPKNCPVYLGSYIKWGASNDASAVMKLQQFLNSELGLTLAVNGIYDQASYDAVIKFQERYSEDVLAPWGETKGTGYVYLTTARKINFINCKNLGITADTTPVSIVPGVAAFTRNLSKGMTGADVTALQQYLINQNKGPTAIALKNHGVTQLFGSLTTAALAEFQAVMGITPAVGYFGPLTRAVVNGG